MSTDRDYMLGTSDEELHRLGFQHQVWSGDTTALWRAGSFGFGSTLIDLGAGPGFATLDLARLVGPTGRVIAIEASSRFVEFTRRQLDAASLANVTLVEGDVHELDLEDTSVDGVFARWLFCFVKDPARVVSEVARILRPGGTLVVMDYFNYHAATILPDSAVLASLFEAYFESAVRNGGSYDIGNRLPALAAEAGLEITSIDPLCHIGRPGSLYWEWLAMFSRGYVPKLVEAGIWTDSQRDDFERAWSAASANPSAFFFTPPVLGMVAKKPSP